jgi:epoxyqueuosine reductase
VRLIPQIKERAAELGFDHFALTRPEVFPEDKQAFSSWVSDGCAADMSYMTRDPDKRMKPQSILPDVKSIITLGVSYYKGPFPDKPGPAYGRVARYAWGLDYHDIILERLNQLLETMREFIGEGFKAALAVDTKPLMERALARRGGRGFIGKNTVFILPRSPRLSKSGFHVGSWIFLAEVLLDMALEETTDRMPVSIGCGGCTRCLEACPTDAFERPYRLRADRCIAYWTIENKGWIPRDMRPKLGDWLFGCDVCQEVCPFNARARQSLWPEFEPEKGSGPWVSLHNVLTIKDQPEFKVRYAGTPLLRPKRTGLIRNACVVAGNSNAHSLIPALKALLEDPVPLVRGHALWALSKILSSHESRRIAESHLKNDDDPQVKSECEAVFST